MEKLVWATVMLHVALSTIFWCAETSAQGTRDRFYRRKRETRAISNQATLVELSQSNTYPRPTVFKCVLRCNEYTSCRAVNDFRNGTCELVHSDQYTTETDGKSSMYFVREHHEYACPTGYEYLFQPGLPTVPSCYKVVLDKLDWQSMRDHCGSMSGDLISIETAEEQSHIRDILNGNDTLKNAGDYWTSASDVDVQGSWKWMATGSAVTYNDAFNPNLLVPGCIILRMPRNWAWNDRQCHRTVYGICERAAEFTQS